MLGVVAVTAFLTAGTFAGLYVSAGGDRDATAARLDDRRTALSHVTDQVAATDEALDEAKRRGDRLESTRAELAECVDAVRHYLWDGLAGAGRRSALSRMFTLCQ